VIDLEMPVEWNLVRIAQLKTPVQELTAVVLDRDRNRDVNHADSRGRRPIKLITAEMSQGARAALETSSRHPRMMGPRPRPGCLRLPPSRTIAGHAGEVTCAMNREADRDQRGHNRTKVLCLDDLCSGSDIFSPPRYHVSELLKASATRTYRYTQSMVRGQLPDDAHRRRVPPIDKLPGQEVSCQSRSAAERDGGGQFLVAAAKALQPRQWEWIATARCCPATDFDSAIEESRRVCSGRRQRCHAFTSGFRWPKPSSHQKALPDRLHALPSSQPRSSRSRSRAEQMDPAQFQTYIRLCDVLPGPGYRQLHRVDARSYFSAFATDPEGRRRGEVATVARC